jgi:hypothetical protein
MRTRMCMVHHARGSGTIVCFFWCDWMGDLPKVLYDTQSVWSMAMLLVSKSVLYGLHIHILSHAVEAGGF